MRDPQDRPTGPPLASARTGYEDTVPTADAALQPDLGWRLPATPRNVDELMVLARRHNRVCPRPDAWRALHALLPPLLHRDGTRTLPPEPLVGPQGERESNLRKRLRLREQIDWAERAGRLRQVHDFLAALPEHQWLHFSE